MIFYQNILSRQAKLHPNPRIPWVTQLFLSGEETHQKFDKFKNQLMCSQYYIYRFTLTKLCQCAQITSMHTYIMVKAVETAAAIENQPVVCAVLVFRQIPFYINECETCIRWITRHCEPQKPQRSMALSHFLKKCGREPGN